MYGGNWFFIVEPSPLPVAANIRALRWTGKAGIGTVSGDVARAYGGNWFFIVEPSPLSYGPGHNGGVIPSITGQAFVTAESKLLFDPADPFRDGIDF